MHLFNFLPVGSNNAQAIEDMVAYAQETQHEKIIRGLAVGIALVCLLRCWQLVNVE